MTLECISGKAYRLPFDNIDTDQIIAARHLKTLTRAGLGAHAFEGLRAAIDDPRVSGAPILIAGANFGCGSSREHAVWALMDLGVKAVLTPSFSDIFASNSFKCGLIAIPLDDRAIEKLMVLNPGVEITVDLQSMKVRAGKTKFSFEMDLFRRDCLLKGLDEIGLTLGYAAEIEDYELNRRLTPASNPAGADRG